MPPCPAHAEHGPVIVQKEPGHAVWEESIEVLSRSQGGTGAPVREVGDVRRHRASLAEVHARRQARTETVSSDRLADRLHAARDRLFAGRVAERDLLRSALGGTGDGFAVLYLHGPGGIGKTMLLQRFAADARAAGRLVVEVDARSLEPHPAAFEAVAEAVLTTDRAVLLVDTFERCQGLSGWLRDRFLPRLPVGALVVIAGRQPPDPGWISDPGWSEALRVVALSELSREESAAVLAGRGVPASLHGRLMEFAGGNPLALTLAAEVAVRDDRAPDRWEPSQDVVQALLSQLVGDVPTATHRTALEVCAHVQVTTEALLRVVLGDDAAPMFAWLRKQPFVESSRHGLFPHDVVREALAADLRWRDPESHRRMHELLDAHLLTALREAAEPDVLRAAGEFTYLYRSRTYVEAPGCRHEGQLQEDPFEAPDRDTLVALTAAAEGPESARIAEYWLDRRPEDFYVYRSTRTGETAGFFAWLRLTEPGDGAEADPVAATLWAHARRTAALRGNEHIALTRFPLHPSAPQRHTPVSAMIQRRSLALLFRSPDIAMTYFLLHRDDPWTEDHKRLLFTPIDVPGRVDGREYTLFAHDWRVHPIEEWYATTRHTEVAQPPAGSAGRVVLSRADFDAAVRDALRSWGRPGELAANPLNRSRLVTESGSTLHEVIRQAVEALLGERNGSKYHQVVLATFTRGTPTQQAVANRLGLAFSTYRRYLSRGIELLCQELWRRELDQ